MKIFKRANLHHILRAAKELTGQSRYVVIGSAALIARLRHVPLEMSLSPEADIYTEEDDESVGALIDGVLGAGSDFHARFGYYADGVSAATAIMPTDWKTRTKEYEPADAPGIMVICPDEHDIALAKHCAWREKDQEWLRSGLRTGVLKLGPMLTRLGNMPSNAPDGAELERRINAISVAALGKPYRP